MRIALMAIVVVVVFGLGCFASQQTMPMSESAGASRCIDSETSLETAMLRLEVERAHD